MKQIKFTMMLAIACILSALSYNKAGAAINLELFPVSSPPSASASYVNNRNAALDILRMKTLRPAAIPGSPTTPQFLGFRLKAKDLMFSTGNLWNGQMNPSGVFQNERGNVVIWYVVAIDDSPTPVLNLQMLRFVGTSNDPGNSLGKTASFASSSYSSGTIGVTASGQVITSGPGNVPMKMVIAGVINQAYAANNQSGIDAVNAYVAASSDFIITGRFDAVDGVNTLATVSKSLHSTWNPTAASIAVDNSTRVFTITGGTSGVGYRRQISRNLVDWMDDSIVLPGEMGDITQHPGYALENKLFFRLAVQED